MINEFHHELGNTVEANTSSIVFFWSNWEYLYSLYPERIKVDRVTPNSWSAKGFFTYGEFHLIKSKIGINRGYFDFFSFLKIFGFKFKVETRLNYVRIDESQISYHGKSITVFPAALKLFHWFLQILATRASQHVNDIGGKSIRQITANPEILKDKVGNSCYEKYLEIRKEEELISKGRKTDPEFFEIDSKPGIKDQQSENDELYDLKKRLAFLEEKFGTSNPTYKLDDHHSAIKVFYSDPEMALVKNRKIIEHIAKILFESELNKPSGTRMLGNLIDLIAKESNNVPSQIIALMRTVSLLGNVGGHVDSTTKKTSIDASEFNVSFMSTIRVTEWFFTEYNKENIENM